MTILIIYISIFSDLELSDFLLHSYIEESYLKALVKYGLENVKN